MLSYTRKFIILRREFSTLKGMNPKGHCKLEIRGIRGTASINIENAEMDNFYNVLLISRDKENSVLNLGKIITNNLGRGKGEYTLNLRELENKGLTIGKVAGILITKGEDVLLGGYLDREDGTIERYIDSMVTQGQEEPREVESPEDFQEEPIEDLQEETLGDLEEREAVVEPYMGEYEKVYEQVYGEAMDEMPEEVPEEIIAEDYEEVDWNYNPDYDIPARETRIEDEEVGLEEAEEVEKGEAEGAEEEIEIEEMEQVEDLEEVDEIGEEEIDEVEIDEVEIDEVEIDERDEIDEIDPEALSYMKKLNQKDQTIGYVLSILRYFPYAEPFKFNLRGHNWWMVDLDEENEYRAFLPYFSYIAGGNNKGPFENTITCNYLMNKYGHYLFGLYNEGEEVKYFAYGIPGEFIMEEHPSSGTKGFGSWHQGQDAPGYWVIYIDPITGKPVQPEIPMAPID